MTAKPGRRRIVEQFLADGMHHMFGNPGTVEQGFLDALRHYPEMKATMLEVMGHPDHHMASKAADALVDMLGIIPGSGERDYERWKTWAMEQVPPELRVKPPTKMDILFKREPHLDRRQLFFWNACTQAHEEAMRNSKG